MLNGKRVYFTDVCGMVADDKGGVFLMCKIVDKDGNVPEGSGFSEGLQLIYLHREGNPGKPAYSKFDNYTYVSEQVPEELWPTLGYPLTFYSEPKQMFLTGDKLYIFPDKLAVSTNFGDAGIGAEMLYYVDREKLNFRFPKTSGTVNSRFRPCNAEGVVYTGQTVSATAPASPTTGKIWVDTSGTTKVWKKYSGSQWINMSDVYVLIDNLSLTAQDTWFKDGDGVDLDWNGDNSTIDYLKGSHIIIKANPEADAATLPAIVITGIIAQETYLNGTNKLRIERKVPDMDYIVLAQNRLWGCMYDSNKRINEIYCSKLGDFTNWNVFQGLSTDSYVASVGTPGEWTGAANVGGYPCFFKEDVVHKIYPSSTGAHQIMDKPCHGIQRDCGAGAAVVGDVLFYKSKAGIMAYDGSTWTNIGEALGGEKYTKADGGVVGDKYYVALKDTRNEWGLFVFDTQKNLWHKEDNLRASLFCHASGDSYYCVEKTDETQLCIITDYGIDNATTEGPLNWQAVTGLQGYDYTGHKYISRFNVRMILPKGSELDIYIEYDSSGKWEHAGHIKGMGTRSFLLPVRPRRCDHFRIKFIGTGEVRIYSFAKYYEQGSDAN